MVYETGKEAWQEVLRLGYFTHTYEWNDKLDGWVVREKTAEEKKETQRTRTELQTAHDESLPGW